MIAAWMLYGTVVALLAGLGALALERGARLLVRAGRWCWVGAMVVTIALPVAAWFRPSVLQPVPITLRTVGGSASVQPRATSAGPALQYRVGHDWTWSDFNRPLAAAWGLLTLGMLTWFAVGSWRLARMRRTWRAEGGILVSESVGPAVIGFLRCQVVVPEWSLELSTVQRELLLAHEAEHLSAHDSRLLVLSAAVLAAVPWNPGLWWQFRRLRLAIELDCDQRVLRRRPDPATYGRLLLDVGARAARSFLPVAAFHEPPSSLEERIRQMTVKRPKRAPLLAALTAVGAGVATFLACEAPRPTAPAGQQQSFTVQTQEEEGQLIRTFIADSVQRYFGANGSQGPVYLWFVVSPDSHVLRHGITRRALGNDVNRSQEASSVVPGFQFPKFQSVTVVGPNAMGAGSQPVYWAVLRDPNRLPHASPEPQTLALVPWVKEAMAKYHPELLAAKNGAPVEIWFIADSTHRVLGTKAVAPQSLPGVALGPTTAMSQFFPGLSSGTITSITPGGATGWASKNVQVIWVTVGNSPAVREWIEREGRAVPNSGRS